MNPLTVSSSNIIWSSVVDVESSGVNPPFTSETFATAPPPSVFALLNTKSSPISKLLPASSIIKSVIPPLPIALT